MIEIEQVRQMALALPDAEELPHFGMPSFRWRNKIFITLRVTEQKAMVMLSLIDQSVFCAYSAEIFYPVPGVWGTKGYTFVELSKVHPEMFQDALNCAYSQLLSKQSSKKKSK